MGGGRLNRNESSHLVPAVRTFFFLLFFSPPCREDWGEWEEEDDTEETADSLGGAIVRQAREATPGTDSTDTTPVPSLGTRRPAAAKVRTDSVEPPKNNNETSPPLFYLSVHTDLQVPSLELTVLTT